MVRNEIGNLILFMLQETKRHEKVLRKEEKTRLEL